MDRMGEWKGRKKKVRKKDGREKKYEGKRESGGCPTPVVQKQYPVQRTSNGKKGYTEGEKKRRVPPGDHVLLKLGRISGNPYQVSNENVVPVTVKQILKTTKKNKRQTKRNGSDQPNSSRHTRKREPRRDQLGGALKKTLKRKEQNKSKKVREILNTGGGPRAYPQHVGEKWSV